MSMIRPNVRSISKSGNDEICTRLVGGKCVFIYRICITRVYMYIVYEYNNIL